MNRRIPSILVGLCALALALASGAAGGPGTPERIYSRRVRLLPAGRYEELRKEWKAYTEAHPNDPMGWAELSKAARYAGVPCTEYVRYAEKAVRVGPSYAGAYAALGSFKWQMYCGGQPEDPSEAIRLLERALKLDPDLDDPHYTLWVMRLSQGRRQEADGELRTLLDGGHIPEPLADFAYNLLVGLEPDAILLTNGDNDTYPPLALQAARAFRPDVAVVNLSLLNVYWYRAAVRSGPLAVPVPLLDKEGAGPQSAEAVKGLIASLKADGWKRPLYVAVTVPVQQQGIPNKLSLEGIVYRVLPEAGEGLATDAERLALNLDKRYRLESATSLAINWTAWSSLPPLMSNYAGAYARLAGALARSGDLGGAREQMSRALALCEFHHAARLGRDLVGGWSEWDPTSPDVARWKEKFGQ